MILVCDFAPVSHEAWDDSYSVAHAGNINCCFVNVASAVEDLCRWHGTAHQGWSHPGFDVSPVCVLE